jgi:S1-C subfamily serine protease
MKKTILVVALFAGPACSLLAAPPEDSVVRVFATVRYPNPLKPWTNGNQVEISGSATVIDGNRILTNAHLVLYASDVLVQARRGGDKIEAKVEMVAPDMDLAVLTVKDAKFFDKCPALLRSKSLPKAQDNVAVYGFPLGGNDLSVTKGVVSRIDFGAYSEQATGLIVQVSAAINPGNSGGPAVVGDKMIGIVFSRLQEQQNIGYIIPNEEIDLFLDDIKDGRYDGKPVEAAGTTFQRCDNKALRSFLNLKDDAKGILVLPPRNRPKGYPFEEFDLLVRIGTHEIDNEGMVQLSDTLRTSFLAVIVKAAKDNAVPVTIIRKGKRIETSMAVSRTSNMVIRAMAGEKPPYFIHGPLVFAPAKVEAVGLYARVRPDLQSLQSPLFDRFADRVRVPGEELVVVTSPMFAHKITKGYADPVGQVVTEVNGTKVLNLKHLVELLRDCKDDYLTFRFAESGSEILVFRRDEMEKATEDTMDDNGIRPTRRGSEDMLKVWEKSKGR